MPRQVIAIRAAEPFDYRMCPTCQWQEGGAACSECEDGSMYEIHEEIEEEFFA